MFLRYLHNLSVILFNNLLFSKENQLTKHSTYLPVEADVIKMQYIRQKDRNYENEPSKNSAAVKHNN